MRDHVLRLRRIGALVAVTLFVVTLAACRGSDGSPMPVPTAEPGTPAAPASPTTDATLRHYGTGTIGFDYPSSWTVRPSGLNMHYITVLGFVGTAPSTATCEPIGTNGFTCGVRPNVGSGQVSIEVGAQDGPPAQDPLDRAASPEPGTTVVTIDGAPAFLTEDPSWHQLDLDVPDPVSTFSRTFLRATYAPDDPRLLAQVRDVFASVHYEPPLLPTAREGPSAAARAANRAVETLIANDASYSCFPAVAGTSRTDVVTHLPSYSPLRKPLPVTCETAIAGTPLERWRLTLTISWTAAADRSAGSLALTVWVDLDGNPTEVTGGGGDVPYWP